MNFALKSQRVLLPKKGQSLGELSPAIVFIESGIIRSIEGQLPAEYSGKLIDLGEKVLMPGLCDSHVHMNEPGRTEWEGIATATQAAAAGGITTLIDMPLNSIPPTVTVDALQLKRKSAEKTAYVDYGFWGGVIPGNEKDLEPLIDAGIMGFKAFMIDSGVSEFPMASEKVLRESMPVLAKKGVPFLVHAELESPVSIKIDSHREYHRYLQSRPDQWEVEAIRLMIRLARETGCRVHIVHLSSAKALQDIQQAKKEGLKFTVETCPHYLSLLAEEVPEGATHFKCAPPIRERSNQEALWQGLSQGVIDFIVSDHSPCTPQLKNLETGDFDSAWGGIAGLQFSLSVIWTEMTKRHLALPLLSHWMAESTSKFLNIQNKTGRIESGTDADLVVFDPEAEFKLNVRDILHRHPVTPYLGKTLKGKVEKTFVRGQCVFDSGTLNGPLGKEVRRN
ncbi:MAG: allantoinase AllB [Proteobacteria bacterium]|nr:allantoinase AllB [Pseudomonadota bacterium]NDC23656.1 allantoinase AllB [Pseudomonadota bacterium]NDD03790.1 allantoinase AllB [Pseudomonadota bacterium]NDG25912.1 allantoinase AllB [Pseudomonadota bacterium]